jgi:twitching motility protein PilT
MVGVGGFLGKLAELGGEELLLSPGQPPRMREGGRLRALEDESAAPKDIGELLLKIAPPEPRKAFERTGSVTFAAEYGDLGRFRIHIFRERLGSAAVVRLIPNEIDSFEDLGLPEAAREFCSQRGGLVVIGGSAGSGKTTTLSAMVDLINSERSAHIVTLEDPIEFLHSSGQSLIHQREVGPHCKGYPEALRSSLREGADVIVLGDIPDAETAEAALEAATSGGLVLAEMRAKTASLAIERLLGFFPVEKQTYARATLASSLSGIMVQRLLPRADDNGLVAAFEILISTPAVTNAIRESGAHNIASTIRSVARSGMKLLDDALLELVASGTVDGREAARYAVSDEDFRKKCGIACADLDAEPSGAAEEEASPTAPRPTTTSIMARRMTRAQMFSEPPGVGPRLSQHLTRRSRTAAFDDSEVSPLERSSQPSAEPPKGTVDPQVVAGRRILVVDDDKQIRDLLVRMLERAGAQVEAVGEGRRALTEIESGKYDLATFDILMPDISGLELYDQAVDLVPELRERVLFITGQNTEGTLRDRIASRGGRLLRKPFVAADLLKAAASTLRTESRAS